MSDVRKPTDKKKKVAENTNASEGNAAKPSASPESAEKERRDEMPPPPPPGKVDLWYSQMNNSVWAKNKQGHFQHINDRVVNIMLKRAGYSDILKTYDNVTYQDAEYARIVEENSVAYAGPLGGFHTGLMEYNGSRILVSNSPKILTPVPGEWNTLKDFLVQLLGDEAIYFHGWLKHARRSMLAGLPWGPGQLLVLAGPEGCGKSVLQSLITLMLGGRASSPYKYMAGSTDFNAEIYSAEHGLIGDQNHKMTKGARRAFGAAIKELCVNPEQWIHGKHKGGCTLSAFLRLTLSVNDDPYALQVLPEMDGNVRNKLMILQCQPTKLPFPSSEFPDMHAYSSALKADIPAFLYDLERWDIPPELYDQRYGIRSYHSLSVMLKVNSLSDEWKFWQFVEMYLFSGKLADEWTGTANDLEKILREEVKGESLSLLFHYAGACGQYMTSLAGKMPDRIMVQKIGGNVNEYTVRRNSLPPPPSS